MSNHTYLFNSAVWEVFGDYFDQSGLKYPLEGISKVDHKKNIWLNDLMMKVKNGEEKEIFNFSEIKPLTEDQGFSFWNSQNPDLGNVNGFLVVSGDEIFLSWNSEDGCHSGSNHLHMVDRQHYTQIGYVFKGKERMSSWELHLKRV